MYRHLLVPIDNTELSTATVSRAVEFARTLGARITFFHALPDYAAEFRGDADVVRLTSPDDYAYTYEGQAGEVLAKAESAALAQGVPCDVTSTVSDSPYRAILAAAREAGCDLIFMASHGRRSNIGMMLGSQTLKVLINTEIPVLVSATADPPVPLQAVGIIRDEHRSLSAVLHAWLHLIRSAREQDAAPDAVVMQAILHYIRKFPVALHHPKEEEYLFRKLRQRTSTVNADLDELERQHHQDRELVTALVEVVKRHADGDLPISEIEQAVARYALFIWEHLAREESVILPAAQRYLTEADWDAINAAFSENQDPRFGGDTESEFRRLFSRIVNLAPVASGHG